MAALDAAALKDRALGAWRSFSPSQLVIIAMLGIVSVVAAVAFLRWAGAPTYTVLLAGMEAEDAAAVTAQLDTDGVPYQLEAGGATVLVPSDLVDAERLRIAAAGLPAGKTDGGWAVFDAQGMTSSSFQQQVAYQRAMEGTLGSTLTGIEGVRAATVHLAMPEKKVFTDEQQPVRASVLLDTSRTLDSGAVDAVTRLVSSSVPGLLPEDVSVSDSSGRLLSADGAGGLQDLEAQNALEDGLAGRATSMLDTLLGPGHAVVRVSAEIDTSEKTVDSEVYDPKKSVVLSEDSSLETYTTPNGGTTTSGVIAEEQDQAAAAGGDANDYRKEQASKDLGVSRVVTSEKAGAGGIKRLTVAVVVDRDAPNAPATVDVQNLVANAVGLDPARGDTIAVSTPSFLKVDEAPVEAAPAGGAGSAKALAPTVLGGVLLLLVALGLLRTLKRGSSSEVPADEVTAALASAGGQGALPAGAAAVRELPAAPAQRSSSEPDLLNLVDENPDEVTALLRGWLANSGSDK